MENQRVRISKTMLKDALVRLLQEKSIEKITVYEICAAAQINRTTFYKYFGSQYDLLTAVENDFLTDLESHLLVNTDSKFNAVHRTLEYIAANHQRCHILLNAVSDRDFPGKLFSLQAIRDILDEHIGNLFPVRMEEYARVFFCQGGFAIILKWINGNCKDPAEDVAQLLFMLGSKSD